ncbi:MAG: type toxin-antitoxin system VapC family toxin [Subtercola sp.]|jgi:predicted nucleic acid-binding protein|nr:type toxin-antitoxin system VapC family toxin [Subtercola sp.]
MIMLDTNVISELARPEPSPQVLLWLNSIDADSFFICSMTAAELLRGVARLPRGRRRAQLESVVAHILSVSFLDRIISFDSFAAVRYAEVLDVRSKAGLPISVPDAIIAATALSVGAAQFATRNTHDFTGIGLNLHNPWLAD